MWTKGRKNSGYYKIKLLESKWLKFDVYLLKYPEGSEIALHIDPAPTNYEHHRINLELNSDFSGGIPVVEGHVKGRAYRFRPDIQKHHVTEVVRGTRYVLSIGWLKRV